MNLKQIEARIVRIEAVRQSNPLAHLSEEELDREMLSCMTTIAADYGGDIGATVTALEASPDPIDREAAANIVQFIEFQRRDREHREWTARMVEQQSEPGST